MECSFLYILALECPQEIRYVTMLWKSNFNHLYRSVNLYQWSAGLACAAVRAQCDAIRGCISCCVKL